MFPCLYTKFGSQRLFMNRLNGPCVDITQKEVLELGVTHASGVRILGRLLKMNILGSTP